MITRERTIMGWVVTSLMFLSYAQGVPDQPILLVVNNTNWKLKVTYGFMEKGLTKSLSKAVSPQGMAELPDPQKLTSIKIGTYGKLVRLFSIPREITKQVQESLKTALAQSPTFNTVVLTISLSEGPLNSLKPFKYSIEVTSRREKAQLEVPQERHLMDAFPGIKAILQRGIDVLPRHVLEVPADASAASIESAYKTVANRWQQALKKAHAGNKQGDIKFIEDVLELLEKAYNALTQRSEKSKKEFNDFTFKKIYTSSYYQQ